MSLLQFSGLFVVWLLCTLFIATLTWFEFRRVRFNFNVFFSLLFLLTFFFGFPLTSVLVFRFDVGVAPPEILLQALLSAGCFYAVYYVTYKTRLRKRVADVPRRPLFTMNRVETNLTWVILMGIALDDPGRIPADRLRYDVGLVLDRHLRTSLNTRTLEGGLYAVFEVPHTQSGILSFWHGLPALAADLPADRDRPVIERYAAPMIARHLCEMCVPITRPL